MGRHRCSRRRVGSRAEAGWPDHTVHFEYFKNTTEIDDSSSFQVSLSRSALTLGVAGGQTILAVLRQNGVPMPSSCSEQGACGTCEVAVLEGEPDHQDVYLNDSEKERGDRIMTCVSRAKSDRLGARHLAGADDQALRLRAVGELLQAEADDEHPRRFLPVDPRSDFYPGWEHKSEEFKKINPLGHIPVIDDDGYVLRDAHAILVYLAAKYDPTGRWYPVSDPELIGETAQWMLFAEGTTNTASAARLHVNLGYDFDIDACRDSAHRLFRVLDGPSVVPRTAGSELGLFR